MDDAERKKWWEGINRRRLIGCTCSICMMAGLLTWREPMVVGSDKVAWLPQALQLKHWPHPLEGYYSHIVHASNVSDAGSATQVINPVGIASAESFGVPTVVASSAVIGG